MSTLEYLFQTLEQSMIWNFFARGDENGYQRPIRDGSVPEIEHRKLHCVLKLMMVGCCFVETLSVLSIWENITVEFCVLETLKQVISVGAEPFTPVKCGERLHRSFKTGRQNNFLGTGYMAALQNYFGRSSCLRWFHFRVWTDVVWCVSALLIYWG